MDEGSREHDHFPTHRDAAGRTSFRTLRHQAGYGPRLEAPEGSIEPLGGTLSRPGTAKAAGPADST